MLKAPRNSHHISYKIITNDIHGKRRWVKRNDSKLKCQTCIFPVFIYLGFPCNFCNIMLNATLTFLLADFHLIDFLTLSFCVMVICGADTDTYSLFADYRLLQT